MGSTQQHLYMDNFHLPRNTQKLRRAAVAFLVASTLVSLAHALPITPNDAYLFGTGNTPETIEAGILSSWGLDLGKFPEKYKMDSNGEDGTHETLLASYATTFTPKQEASGATITWVGPKVLGDARFLLVKDGNSAISWYLFNLSTPMWDGKEVLNLSGFWPGPQQGAISYVALYGGGTSVPDGGSTVILIGAALTGVHFLVRRRRRT